MYQKLIYLFLIFFLAVSCSKKEPETNNAPVDSIKSFELYQEAIESMNKGEYFFAAKQFSEAESFYLRLNFPLKLL